MSFGWEQVQRVLRRNQVLDMRALAGQTGGRSRRSLFRDLARLNYLTSYTHAGRYYTLRDIPSFDAYGLWVFREIGFSRAGTLGATVTALVESSVAGYDHRELRSLLRVRVHNTLVSLAREGQIRREGSRRLYVYVSAEPSRADEQMRARLATGGKGAPVTIGPPGTETVIAVLVEALHIGDVRVESAVVADRLTIRGIVVSREQVEDILAPYGLGKKKPRGSRRLGP